MVYKSVHASFCLYTQFRRPCRIFLFHYVTLGGASLNTYRSNQQCNYNPCLLKKVMF